MWNIMVEIIKDWINEIIYVIESNLRHIASMLNMFLPYVMYFVGQYTFGTRGQYAIGSEITLPLFVCFVVYLIRSYANKIGKGTTIPIPQKRFTEIDEGDEVSIEHDRIQELILYTADLEDWLERKGLL